MVRPIRWFVKKHLQFHRFLRQEPMNTFWWGTIALSLSTGLVFYTYIFFFRLQYDQAYQLDFIKTFMVLVIIVYWSFFINAIRRTINRALVYEQEVPGEFRDVLLANCLNRRDKVRRNANIFGLITMLTAWNPAMINEIQYLKMLIITDHRLVVFAVFIIFGLFFMISLAEVSQEYRWRGNLPPSFRTPRSRMQRILFLIFPYHSIREWSTEATPDALAHLGIVAASLRLVWEFAKRG